MSKDGGSELMHNSNILLCGGGTGGHYYPLMAIKKDLELKSDYKFCYVGAKKGIENSRIQNEKIDYKLVSISGIQRSISTKAIFNNIKTSINIFFGFFVVINFFLKQKPDIVISTGGYSSYLPLQIAKILRVPYVLHEQNSYPGVVTKMFSSKAKAIFLGFENANKYMKKSKTIFSGNPILLSQAEDLNLKLNRNLKTILIFGGSQGSKFLNEKIKILVENEQFSFANIIWIVGEKNYDSLKHLSDKNVIIMSYCNSMSSMYQKVDLVVSRSGAMTIAELIHFEKPSILIPFKFSSENHQYYNAKYLQDKLCSTLIEEDLFDSEIFLEKVENICSNERIIGAMVENFQQIETPSTLDIISDFIIKEKYAL
jgi:UDP-N-acetylglucosamine--N-acetylmuramyl-(pentapeptide) pyrophosphoryl-undecaprenol N-acetylglucosamine transferase